MSPPKSVLLALSQAAELFLMNWFLCRTFRTKFRPLDKVPSREKLDLFLNDSDAAVAMKVDIQFSPKLLGKVITEGREILHLSVRALARLSGVSHSQILRIESGEFDCLTTSVVKLCGAMGIPFGDLLDRCVLPDLSIYKKAVETEVVSCFQNDSETQMAIIDMIFGASVTLVYFVRAQNPIAVSDELYYPSDAIQLRFRAIAQQLKDHPMDVSQRFIFLSRLQQKPAATLIQFFGFPSQQELSDYVAQSKSVNKNFSFPWVPERPAPSISTWGSVAWKSKPSGNDYLTKESTSNSLAGVKEQWPALKRKIQNATAETGAKSKLGKFLGVDLTQLSKWLTDAPSAREPGAEYALQMKYWVEHPECQK